MKQSESTSTLREQQLLTLTIQGYTSQGHGVARKDGRVIFVPGALDAETVLARITKIGRNSVWACVKEVLSASVHRVRPACPYYGRCGGCSFWHMDYEEELRAKARRVTDALQRIGGQHISQVPIHAAPQITGYRNKAQYPVAPGADGRPSVGFYRAGSHQVIPIDRCAIQSPQADRAAQAVSAWMNRWGIRAYDEKTGQGLVRHIHVRCGRQPGQTLVCLVINGQRIPQEQDLVDSILRAEPSVVSICLNINRRPGNVVLSQTFLPLYGPMWIEDVLCGVSLRISPASFYQVNSVQAERLYRRAAELAELTEADTVLELYCGIGAITLALAPHVGRILGVEVVPDAVKDAQENAKRSGIRNAEFLRGDAGTIAARLAERGEHPSVLVVDPPRKGVDEAVLQAVSQMQPQKMVYISCDPATLARDLVRLTQLGYHLKTAEAFDLFPRTAHVETVVLLSRKI